MRRIFLITLLIIFLPTTVYAVDAVSFSWGEGHRDSINGGRFSLEWDWPVWFEENPVVVTGYWDASIARWETDGDVNGKRKGLSTVGAAPVLRIQARDKVANAFLPYFEASVGVGLHSTTKIGDSDIGGLFTFQDILGVGVRFGSREQFDFSYRYLHYSNAGIMTPNNGITLEHMFTFTYHLE